MVGKETVKVGSGELREQNVPFRGVWTHPWLPENHWEFLSREVTWQKLISNLLGNLHQMSSKGIQSSTLDFTLGLQLLVLVWLGFSPNGPWTPWGSWHYCRGLRILVPVNCMLRELYITLSVLKFIYMSEAVTHDSFASSVLWGNQEIA